MTEKQWSDEMAGKADPLAQIENPQDADVIEEKRKVETLISTLQAQGMSNVEFDPTIVRGFDYYTGVVFEMWDTHPDNTRSVFGGGRYDRLVEMFSPEKIPAIGFAIGDMPFENFLESHGLFADMASETKVYIGTVAASDIAEAHKIARTLQDAGISTWVNPLEKKVGDQVKEAVKRGIPYFFAVGAEETASGTLRVKHLAKSEEETITLEQLSAYFLSR